MPAFFDVRACIVWRGQRTVLQVLGAGREEAVKAGLRGRACFCSSVLSAACSSDVMEDTYIPAYHSWTLTLPSRTILPIRSGNIAAAVAPKTVP